MKKNYHGKTVKIKLSRKNRDNDFGTFWKRGPIEPWDQAGVLGRHRGVGIRGGQMTVGAYCPDRWCRFGPFFRQCLRLLIPADAAEYRDRRRQIVVGWAGGCLRKTGNFLSEKHGTCNVPDIRRQVCVEGVGAHPSGTPPCSVYCAILLRTYCRIPPLAMYSTSAGTSTLQRVSNSSFWPSR